MTARHMKDLKGDAGRGSACPDELQRRRIPANKVSPWHLNQLTKAHRVCLCKVRSRSNYDMVINRQSRSIKEGNILHLSSVWTVRHGKSSPGLFAYRYAPLDAA